MDIDNDAASTIGILDDLLLKYGRQPQSSLLDPVHKASAYKLPADFQKPLQCSMSTQTEDTRKINKAIQVEAASKSSFCQHNLERFHKGTQVEELDDRDRDMPTDRNQAFTHLASQIKMFGHLGFLNKDTMGLTLQEFVNALSQDDWAACLTRSEKQRYLFLLVDLLVNKEQSDRSAIVMDEVNDRLDLYLGRAATAEHHNKLLAVNCTVSEELLRRLDDVYAMLKDSSKDSQNIDAKHLSIVGSSTDEDFDDLQTLLHECRDVLK